MKRAEIAFGWGVILAVGILLGVIWTEFSVYADEVLLPDVVVTSSRMERPIESTPGFISVIRASDLHRYLSTVSESLAMAPGTNPHVYGSMGSLTWSSLRGSTSDQVLALIDGVRMNNPQGAGFNLGSVPTASIERIEILRGGASALYGADAVGGVVNIITRRPADEPRNRAAFSFGSWMTWTASVGRREKTDWVDYQVDFTHEQSEGDFDLGPYAYEDMGGNTIKRMENNAYRGENLFLTLGWDAGDLHLELANDFHFGTKEVPGLIAPEDMFTHAPTPEAEEEDIRDVTYIKGNWKGFFLPDAQVSARIHSNLQRRSFFDNVFVMEENESEHTNHGLGAEFKWDYPVGSFHLVSLAPEIRWEKIDSTQLHLRERTTVSMFAQDELAILQNRITVVPALRYDYHNDFGGSFSPRLGIAALPLTGLSVKANAGRSFRAPSFDDLYWPADAWSHGNPDLKPETAWNFDVGSSYRFPDVGRIEVSGFYNIVDDLIQWAADSDGTWSPENVGQALMWGVESGISSRVSQFARAGISYTYLRTEDQSGTEGIDGNDLIYRPRHRLSATFDLEWKKIRAFSELMMVGERYTDMFNARTLDSYVVFNQGLGMSIKSWGDIAVKMKNVLDERYQDILGYPRPGREILLNVAAEF